ncbi:hypothetical protein [Streptomyces sp. NPDC058291]|jgi:hypothetical protein|uniref:hypothetical protein n=1 Tax=Streptomyces sp. NPDC058291 TaxID=3346427 RepID=UPI0036E6CE65
MHPDTHLALHRVRAAELRAEADAHRLAVAARLTGESANPAGLRTRVGWALVEVGLRLAAAPRTGIAAL